MSAAVDVDLEQLKDVLRSAMHREDSYLAFHKSETAIALVLTGLSHREANRLRKFGRLLLKRQRDGKKATAVAEVASTETS